ncbi:GtrA family protein [Miniphocaeibacter halophilus]|uniref:GtrA family protein n=1 Tax=Miniphocaeibacter halophilus TaxID=2931922 RepID=A0AC61NH35_9FIRM|nr:GtrA family protein [Miniphocaeibacter halophilus]QQK09053.1 GtrA family protein [Miniphocaeibacter halophilus]
MIIKNIKKYKSIIIYLITGIFTTVVNLTVYSVLVKYGNFNINIANIIAWISAVVFAFFTNKIFVFNSRNFKIPHLLREFALFLGGRLLTGIIEIVGFPILMFFGIDQIIFGIEGLVAKFLIGAIVVILNYFFSKYFVFKNRKVNK